MKSPRAALGPLKKLRPHLPIIGASLLAAVATTIPLLLLGFLSSVPSVIVPLAGWVVPGWVFVLLLAFVCYLVLGLLARYYLENRERIRETWLALSQWVRAVVVGFVAAVLVAVLLGVATVLGETTLFVTVLGFLVAWPLGVAAKLLRDSKRGKDDSSGGVTTSVFVSTGYAQMKRLETRTLSVIVGSLVGVLSGVAIRYVGGVSLFWTVLAALAIWFAVTVLVFNRYESTAGTRTDLAIVAVSNRDSRESRELSLRNESAESVTLTQTKLRDTEFDLYRLGVDVRLGPGEICTFEIPDSFSLEPNDEATSLPLGYTLKEGEETPTVYTRTGEEFDLHWAGEAERPTVDTDDRTFVGSDDSSADPTTDTAGQD